jgi:ribonuclease P protein component
MARFSPNRRLKRRADFLRVQGSKRKFRSRFFLLALSPRESSEEPTRLGITITTKVDKRAVRRNRLRRRIRELYRTNLEVIPSGFDAVIIALNDSVTLPAPAVREEICFLLRKAKRELHAR